MSTCLQLTKALGTQLKKNQLTLAVAESCTGGSLAAALTAMPGSSSWFDRGFVTYSNQAKQEMLGVQTHILQTHGAVSEATVCKMAEGAIHQSDAHLSVAISGIAGPDGGTADKPVGTVWIAFAGLRQPTKAVCYTFLGNRQAIREAAVLKALEGLIKRTDIYVKPAENNPRYFFALWPDEATKDALATQADLLTQTTHCRPSLPQNLHLTLAYLDTLTPEECDRIKSFNCPLAPFELKLTAALHWPELALAYFNPAPSNSLKALHDFLNQHLLAQGFKPERRAFLPHITLARDYQNTLAADLFKPTHWFVHELCFVQSTPHPDTSDYQIITRTPLTLKTC